jgi:hypothetical protein
VKELKDKARQYKDAATKEKERGTQLESELTSVKQQLESQQATESLDDIRGQLEMTIQDKRVLEQQIRELKEQHLSSREESERVFLEKEQVAEAQYRS